VKLQTIQLSAANGLEVEEEEEINDKAPRIQLLYLRLFIVLP